MAAPRRGVLALDRIQEALGAVLISSAEPPPSVHAVMRRLGCTNWVYKRFPELCRAISARYKAYQRARAMAWPAVVEADVRQAICHLVAQGTYPASKRIIPLLRHPMHPKNKEFTCARQRLLRELGVSREPSATVTRR